MMSSLRFLLNAAIRKATVGMSWWLRALGGENRERGEEKEKMEGGERMRMKRR